MALLEIACGVSDDGDKAEREATEHDKEVSNCHLVCSSVVVTVEAVVHVGVFHPAGRKVLRNIFVSCKVLPVTEKNSGEEPPDILKELDITRNIQLFLLDFLRDKVHPRAAVVCQGAREQVVLLQ